MKSAAWINKFWAYSLFFALLFTGSCASRGPAERAELRHPEGIEGKARVSGGKTAHLIAREERPIVEKSTVLMGTEVSILIQTEDTEKGKAAIQEGFAEIRRIENLMTDWREPSEVMNLIRAAGQAPVSVGPELLYVLEESRKMAELTEGAFDITYAGVGRLWNFSAANPAIPAPEQIADALTTVDYRMVTINRAARTAFLTKRGMRIGLGGIAKGYAVDRAADLIRKQGFENFAVNAGGDLTVRGRKEGRLWWVAIRHPRDPEKNIAILPVSNGSVVTSGDSERFFFHKGQRYSHIIDPRTGYPSQLCQSVTIMAKETYVADALATGVFVLGPEKGMELIESLSGAEAMIVDQGGKVLVSRGLTREGTQAFPTKP